VALHHNNGVDEIPAGVPFRILDTCCLIAEVIRPALEGKP
jgi:hypothetical protein